MFIRQQQVLPAAPARLASPVSLPSHGTSPYHMQWLHYTCYTSCGPLYITPVWSSDNPVYIQMLMLRRPPWLMQFGCWYILPYIDNWFLMTLANAVAYTQLSLPVIFIPAIHDPVLTELQNLMWYNLQIPSYDRSKWCSYQQLCPQLQLISRYKGWYFYLQLAYTTRYSILQH